MMIPIGKSCATRQSHAQFGQRIKHRRIRQYGHNRFTIDPLKLETVKCPLCGTAEVRHVATESTLQINQCLECELAYVSPRIREPEKNYWFEEEVALSKYDRLLSDPSKHPRDRNYREYLSWLKAVKPTGRLLDVGTHLGWFLNVLQTGPWQTQGIEPSPTASKIARERLGLDVRTGYLEADTFPPASFDIVTLIDVMEHVTHPVELLRIVHRVLKPDGIVFIKTPNFRWNVLKHRVLVQLFRSESFDIFDAAEHVVQYTEASLRRMLKFTGFRDASFRVPLPVQTYPQEGSWWRMPTRETAYWVTRGLHTVTGNMTLAPDLAVIARR
jgi:2-polyprenyl-3-methyl-5-hydroxy-6-metoxy-1,4-benzoquinol methylase